MLLDACVLTIVRDGDDYLEACMRAVIPYVKRVRITVDSRSTDRSWSIANRLREEFSNVEPSIFAVTNPIRDLVEMRNSQMYFPEKWGFIVDSDELHPFIKDVELGDRDAYALNCYAVWNRDHIHKSSSRARIGRIFRNTQGLRWIGRFGKEALYNGNKKVFTKDTEILPQRYIHFPHLKKDQWRNELNQARVADGKYLSKTPERIISIIDTIHENMSSVPRFRDR